MVTINKIYTKTGDKGTTALGDGSRRAKYDIRVDAYGTVDEANAVIGIASSLGEKPIKEFLDIIQNDLFDIGADLCRPIEEGQEKETYIRIKSKKVKELENAIDKFNEGLPPLKSFILPSGNMLASYFHLARTVIRRAERLCVELSVVEEGKVNLEVIRYLNRLSDLMFVLARRANSLDDSEKLWVPDRN